MKYLVVLLFLNSAWADVAAVKDLAVPSQLRMGHYDPVQPNRYGDLCINGDIEIITEDGHKRVQLNELEAINLVSQFDIQDAACQDVTDITSSESRQATLIKESTVRRCGTKKPIAVESREWKVESGHISLKSTDLIDRSGSYSCEWRLHQ